MGEIATVGTPDEEPTIDRIEVAEFSSNVELQEWLKKNVPAFLRK
jgi:hypothetical protein